VVFGDDHWNIAIPLDFRLSFRRRRRFGRQQCGEQAGYAVILIISILAGGVARVLKNDAAISKRKPPEQPAAAIIMNSAALVTMNCCQPHAPEARPLTIPHRGPIEPFE
jgi:hypothetical protein